MYLKTSLQIFYFIQTNESWYSDEIKYFPYHLACEDKLAL